MGAERTAEVSIEVMLPAVTKADFSADSKAVFPFFSKTVLRTVTLAGSEPSFCTSTEIFTVPSLPLDFSKFGVVTKVPFCATWTGSVTISETSR